MDRITTKEHFEELIKGEDLSIRNKWIDCGAVIIIIPDKFENIEIVDSKISSPLLFKGCNLAKCSIIDVRVFHQMIFQECNFDNHESLILKNVSFMKGNLSFIGCVFQTFRIFNFSSNIFRWTDFTNCTFNDRVTFTYDTLKFIKVLAFKECTFEDYVEFNFSADRLDLENSNFNKSLKFYNSEFRFLNMEGVRFENIIGLKGIKISNGTQETFRILKHEFLSLNNRIDAFKYFKLEMEAFRKNLKRDKKRWWNSSDRLIIELNRLSNDYSNDWKRGVFFTIGIGVLFFTLYFLAIVEKEKFIDELPSSIGYFVKFLYPAHSFDFMEEYTPCGIAYIIDFVGRIFIGYGYYQTIQAFRKFGKW
ncbi:hypothetical protein [Carboxylicivirga sp. M1479]|uniref:hypothetical protein n=1 Tax=Carboxylicivirga sp. M1479 TaxID=2594476 RepID=UPI00117747A5|nr:hypothetical protein [Carboxylicivirga sp. M1479]TRX70782.1 hypothetical protein FNN09_09835 [Carboxylicivirga sp. M1479]